MDLELILSRRIGISLIHEIVDFVNSDDEKMLMLYNQIFAEEDRIAYNAIWVMTYFSSDQNRWLHEKQDELIDQVLICKHHGKRRLLLTLLYRQAMQDPPRVDFLDFCLEGVIILEDVGSQSLCLKLAYEMCRTIPELCNELRGMLEMMEPSNLSPALNAVRRNSLIAMKKGKSLQTFK